MNGNEVDDDEEMPEDEMPERVTVTPTVETPTKFVGRFNLKEELDHLKSEWFDNLNYDEKIEKYGQVLGDLDTGIRDLMEMVAAREAEINKKLEHPSIKDDPAISSDSLYIAAIERGKTLGVIKSAMAQQSWQIQFLVALINKLRRVLDGIKGASEEKIVVQTMKDGYKDLMLEFKTMRDDDRKSQRELDDARRKHDMDMMMQILNIAGLKDGVEINKLQREVAKLKSGEVASKQTTEEEPVQEATKRVVVPLVQAPPATGVAELTDLKSKILTYIREHPRLAKSDAAREMNRAFKGEYPEKEIYDTMTRMTSEGTLIAKQMGFRKIMQLPGE